MEEIEDDFNQLLKSKLSKRIAKKDLLTVLETCKNVLKKEIEESKNFESIFQEETWNIFISSIEGFDNFEGLIILELFQLFSIIIPTKGKERKLKF
jgi:uncharacterized protein YktA (UPF0223 family)